MTPSKKSIPQGLCQCGCGEKTKLSRDTDKPRGRVKGNPMRFVVGHNATKPRPKLAENLIPLNEVRHTRISLIDRPDLGQFNWFLTAQGYVARNTEVRGMELMHRRIMRARKGQYVDHIDGDRTNNERENLRICSNSQNCMNRGPQANSKHGYKGVSWSNVSKKWRAYIKVQGSEIHLGLFESSARRCGIQCSSSSISLECLESPNRLRTA